MDEATTQIATGLWAGPNLSFWLVTLIVLVSGAMAAFARNIVQAAFSLFFTLLGMAGYYVLLGSAFLAITQVIIYVGGILVLLMFGVLLTHRLFERPGRGYWRFYGVSIAFGAVLLIGVLVQIVLIAPWKTAGNLVMPESSTRLMGNLLLTDYLLPLEVVGMLLLLCLLAAAYLVRRRER